MKKYLTDTFLFNDKANKQMLVKLKTMPQHDELIKLFSHLINCQYKWMMRLTEDELAKNMSWWEPIYNLNEMEEKWTDSLRPWLQFIKLKTEDELRSEVHFTGSDGYIYAATPMDIVLQLNYHSIHHRAQMQMIIRQNGYIPEFIDYIGMKYRKL